MNVHSFDPDQLRELCADRICRIVLAVLVEQPRRLTVNDLTRAVVKHDHDAPITEIDGETVEAIERDLIEEHLPTLAGLDLIEFDAERRRLAPGDRLDEAAPTVAEIVEDDPDFDVPVEL